VEVTRNERNPPGDKGNNPPWNPTFWQSDDEFYRFGAVTPRSNCILDPSKLVAAGIKIRSVGEALEDALKRWKPEAV
jgi:hypothetical protein